MPTKNEETFWTSVAQQFAAEWDVRLVPGKTGGGLAGLNSAIYVIDTSNGWSAMGAFPESTLASAAALLRAQSDQKAIIDNADLLCHECAGRGIQGDHPDLLNALNAAIVATSGTRTYSVAPPTPAGMTGHWLRLLYRLADGSLMGRPMHLKTNGPSMLSASKAFAIARDVLATDLSNPASLVGSTIRACGGLVLDEAFSDQPGRERPTGA